MRDQVDERCDHGFGSLSSAPVSARKTSSSERPASSGMRLDDLGERAGRDAAPRRMTKSFVHNSSTSVRRCELRIDGRALAGAIRDGRAHAPHAGRIEAGERLVENEDAGGSCSRPQAMASFCFMPRDSSVESALALVGDLELVEQGRDARLGIRDVVQATDEAEMLLDREVIEEMRLVGNEGERLFRRDGVRLDVVARDASTVPSVGAMMPDEAAQRRRLAGAVRTDEPEDLPGADVERDSVDGGKVAVLAGEILDGDHAAGSVNPADAGERSCTRESCGTCVARRAQATCSRFVALGLRHDASAAPDCFAIVAPGLEPFAIAEARGPGVGRCRGAGRHSPGTERRRACSLANVALRIASRVLVRLASFEARSFAELERHARKIEWTRVIAPGDAVRFRVTCKKSKLYHSDAVAQRLADAVKRAVPSARVEGGSVADDDADETPEDASLIVVRVMRDRCTVSADSSGALFIAGDTGWRARRHRCARRSRRRMLAASGWDAVPRLWTRCADRGRSPSRLHCRPGEWHPARIGHSPWSDGRRSLCGSAM